METLTKIKSAIIKNNGATLTSAGEYANIKTGYIVSEEKHGVILSVKEFNNKSAKYFNMLLKKAYKLGAFLGFWLHNGCVYIDFNKHINDKSEAIKYAQEQKQLAIWDCVNACEIKTGEE